jgi:hypothetical protein
MLPSSLLFKMDAANTIHKSKEITKNQMAIYLELVFIWLTVNFPTFNSTIYFVRTTMKLEMKDDQGNYSNNRSGKFGHC